jgi:hypothetical protein
MAARQDATISGFNEYIQTLQKKTANVLMTLLTFNTLKMKTDYAAKPIKDVPKLTRETYRPDNGTPLYDAIAHGIHMTERKTKGDVLFIIMTDGEENSSKEYNRDKVFELIKKKEKAGWSFVYLGANQDSYGIGMSLGISTGNTMNYSTAKMGETMSYMAENTVAYASMSTSARGMSCCAVLQDKDENEKKLGE